MLQERCIAFGDSFNDVSMVEWAGQGIAMASGRPELQAIADRIAPPADDDGVGASCCRRFFRLSTSIRCFRSIHNTSRKCGKVSAAISDRYR